MRMAKGKVNATGAQANPGVAIGRATETQSVVSHYCMFKHQWISAIINIESNTN